MSQPIESETNRETVEPSIPADGSTTPLRWPHGLILVAASAVLLASFLMQSEGATDVFLPGTSSALPDICMTKSQLGLDCPGCGLTRSMINISHGHWGKAFLFNPAGFLVYGFVLGQIPWQITQLIRISRNQGRLIFPFAWLSVGVMLAVLFIQWIVKIAVMLATF